MNSRSSVNETNLVNYSTDLPTLNQLDTKEGLLSFPFDHIYACHSEESSDRRQTLTLDKEVEISTHCLVTEKELVVAPAPSSDVSQLTERLAISENQNKKLKNLLIYHLDLIQQQNQLITKREKIYQKLKQENDTLKSRLTRIDRRVSISQRQSFNCPPPAPMPPVTSTVVKSEPGPSHIRGLTELIVPDTFLFDSDPKPFGQEPSQADVTSFLSADLGVPSTLDSNFTCDDFKMIESKPSYVKKDTEGREAIYTVTSNSGNPVIQRIQRSRRKTTSSLGSLSRMSKSTAAITETPGSGKSLEDKAYNRTFNVKKKSKMINTYGKSRNSTSSFKGTSQFGSLSDRLQLIDTTPTGEDPYQLGEADMREQSPIPKLMLQKTNHGRMKICTDTHSSCTITTETDTKETTEIKLNRYNLPNPYMHPSELKSESPKTEIVHEPDLDIVKTETEIDWRMYKPGNETSLCDFSYGETPNLATSHSGMDYSEFFATDSSLNLDNLNAEMEFSIEKTPDKPPANKSKKRTARTTSLVGPNFAAEESVESNKKKADSKRGRKRASSTTGLLKKKKIAQKKEGSVSKPKANKGRAVCKGKKSPVPGMMTTLAYPTQVGDPDLSWYVGLDPDVKIEDLETHAESAASTVEVPRWREKPYSPSYSMEGTENLDDKVFEKRHQKLEAEERRQLRWHMRRIREQRQVERLRQRQRESWRDGGASPVHSQPSMYTIWPQPQRDLRYIEITDMLPIAAFGAVIPIFANVDFVLPWVRKSKPLKRSKRSKTLH